MRDTIVPVTTPIFGVRGNHNTTRIVSGLEAMGIRMLMNENEPIERDGSRLWIAGVDDPHHYRTDDLGIALTGIPDSGSTVLLAHSADALKAAAAAGVSLILSGHTHGG